MFEIRYCTGTKVLTDSRQAAEEMLQLQLDQTENPLGTEEIIDLDTGERYGCSFRVGLENLDEYIKPKRKGAKRCLKSRSRTARKGK